MASIILLTTVSHLFKNLIYSKLKRRAPGRAHLECSKMQNSLRLRAGSIIYCIRTFNSCLKRKIISYDIVRSFVAWLH